MVQGTCPFLACWADVDTVVIILFFVMQELYLMQYFVLTDGEICPALWILVPIPPSIHRKSMLLALYTLPEWWSPHGSEMLLPGLRCPSEAPER